MTASLRLLHGSSDGTPYNVSSHTDSNNSPSFDPKVFWGVNAFIFFLVVLGFLYCYLRFKCGVRFPTEQEYRLARLQRLQEQRDAKKEDPIKRRSRLKELFQSLNVSKVRRADGGVCVL